jgi:hypothetical protein
VDIKVEKTTFISCLLLLFLAYHFPDPNSHSRRGRHKFGEGQRGGNSWWGELPFSQSLVVGTCVLLPPLAAHALGAVVLSFFSALALRLVVYKPLYPDVVAKESAGVEKGAHNICTTDKCGPPLLCSLWTRRAAFMWTLLSDPQVRWRLAGCLRGEVRANASVYTLFKTTESQTTD